MTTLRAKSDWLFPLENAHWPALIVDGAGVIRRANQAAIDCFGPALDGDSAMLGAILAPEERGISPEQWLASWDHSATPMVHLRFRGKEPGGTRFATYISAVNRDGDKRFVFQLFREAHAVPTPAPPAPPTPPRAPSVEAGMAQKQKLDCAMQLARTIALDFNNALTSILGHASLVLSQMEADHPWRPSLQEVEKAAGKAAEIAHHLATFSRADKDHEHAPPGNLNGVLRRVVETFRQAASSPQVEWQLELEEQLFAARFDEAKLQQAFIKIIENALEAFGQYGRLHVCSRNLESHAPFHDQTVHLEPGCYVCVEIVDDGAGIPAEVLPRIFEPFFTTKPGHRGLGLAWVYGVITNHGGGVTVTSQPRTGTTVRIYLPASKRTVKERISGNTELRGRQSVLIVDDEEALLNLGQTVLSAYGYRVFTANSGARALEILAQRGNAIDLVITDLVMPQMSGRELMEQIRQRAPGTPMLCASGYVQTGEAEDGEPGSFLQKPFTSQELLSRVQEALQANQLS